MRQAPQAENCWREDLGWPDGRRWYGADVLRDAGDDDDDEGTLGDMIGVGGI